MKWISVDDRLPAEGDEILMFTDKKRFHTCTLVDYGDGLVWSVSLAIAFGDWDDFPTHWTPLPHPPENKGGKP